MVSTHAFEDDLPLTLTLTLSEMIEKDTGIFGASLFACSCPKWDHLAHTFHGRALTWMVTYCAVEKVPDGGLNWKMSLSKRGMIVFPLACALFDFPSRFEELKFDEKLPLKPLVRHTKSWWHCLPEVGDEWKIDEWDKNRINVCVARARSDVEMRFEGGLALKDFEWHDEKCKQRWKKLVGDGARTRDLRHRSQSGYLKAELSCQWNKAFVKDPQKWSTSWF